MRRNDGKPKHAPVPLKCKTVEELYEKANMLMRTYPGLYFNDAVRRVIVSNPQFNYLRPAFREPRLCAQCHFPKDRKPCPVCGGRLLANIAKVATFKG